MDQFDCVLSASLIKPVAEPPLLSIIVPTYNRPQELQIAVASIARQIDESLAGKVEILISDNASEIDVSDVLAQLAEEFEAVSFVVHDFNEGGAFQIYAAPFRARGRWTWVFGDDDALVEGALAYVVGILEAHQPGFLTLNRQVLDPTLTTVLASQKHDAPELIFDTFSEFLEYFGFDQVTFLSSQIYETETARAVDTAPYLASPCYYSQVAYYIEGFHDKPTYYAAYPVVLHRWDPGAQAVHKNNFHQLATYFPIIVQFAAEQTGIAAKGYFETINGRRSIAGEEARRITFVDNILENLWRSVALDTVISDEEWDALIALSADWLDGRQGQLAMVREAYGSIATLARSFQAEVAELERLVSSKAVFSDREIELLKAKEAQAVVMQGHVNDSRKTALEISETFS